MKCGICKKELLTQPNKPAKGGLKVDYEKGTYYPVCDKCADTNKQNTTICAECKNYALMGDCCLIGRTDYVHGGYIKVYCEKKNTGSCQDFGKKEP